MAMLAFGVLALFTCFATSFIIMGVYLPQHFTSELVQRILLSAAPWFLAGFAGYLLVSWICSTYMEAEGLESDYCRIDFSCPIYSFREQRLITVSCPA